MTASMGGVKTLLSTDIVDFSRLLETHEMAALEELDFYSALTKRLTREHHGRILSNTGDTFLISFDEAAEAVTCAEQLQRGIRARREAPESLSMLLRIAVHRGELSEREGSFYGETFATVLELRGITRPGAVSISGAVAAEIELDERWARGGEDTGQTGAAMEWYTLSPTAESPGKEAGESSAGARGEPNHDNSDNRDNRDNKREARDDADRGEAASNTSDVKTRLLREMKRRGRRLSLSEAYDVLDVRTPKERRVLYDLAASGFLARGGPQSGAEAHSSVGGAGDTSAGMQPRRRPSDVEDTLLPSRRGVGDEREDREAESAWDQVLSRRFSNKRAPSRDPVVQSYREQTERSLEQVRSGFRGHFISYAGVNGALITMGVVVGALPWLAIPALAWGIGLATHWQQVRQRRREVKALNKIRQLTREKLRVFRRLTKARNSFQSHLVSNAATSIFLFALNMMVSPGFPWFVFPVGGMAIGVLSHYPAFKSKERKLTAELAQIAHDTPAPRATAINPDASPVEQAEELREGILAQMEALSRHTSMLGDDFEQLLDNYVEQVRALTQRAEELDDVLDAHSLGQVGRELDNLEQKRGSTEDRRLQQQYDESMGELRKQRKSIEALMSEREMIALRINSGLNMLKNVRIELIRLKTASDTRDVAAAVEAQSKELVGQLQDLRAAYEELNDDRS